LTSACGSISFAVEVIMDRTAPTARLLFSLAIGALALAAEPRVSAQRGTPTTAPAAAPQPVPEGYMPRGYRPGKGLAPGMRVTDLG